MLMDSKQILCNRLAIFLAVYKDYIGVLNESKHFDVNRLSEGLVASLLTDLAPWGKINVLEKNHISIDLLSEDKTVGIQVTSEATLTKVTDTIEKFKKLPTAPNSLYILMLRGRQIPPYNKKKIQKALAGSSLKFDEEKHIVDLNYLLQLARDADITDGIDAANKRLEAEIGPWATKLLLRHSSSAGRLLELCVEQGLTSQQILEFIGAQKPYRLNQANDIDFVSSLLTAKILEQASQEFHVPLEWLTTESDFLGEKGQTCPWRQASELWEIIEKALRRSRDGVKFYVVTPEETKDFLTLHNDQVVPAGDSSMPILVFCETDGQYGKVYEHLGIQPGEIKHYRKAAIFLIALIRKQLLCGQTRFKIACSWLLWPREQIFATAKNLLLASALREEGGEFYQDGYEFAELSNSNWRFHPHSAWDIEFNNEYAPYIEKKLNDLELDEERVFVKRNTELRKSLTQQLPQEGKYETRIFGGDAIFLAIKCAIDVNVLLLNNHKHQKVTPIEAIKLLNRSVEENEEVCLIYIDVVPAGY